MYLYSIGLDEESEGEWNGSRGEPAPGRVASHATGQCGKTPCPSYSIQEKQTTAGLVRSRRWMAGRHCVAACGALVFAGGFCWAPFHLVQTNSSPSLLSPTKRHRWPCYAAQTSTTDKRCNIRAINTGRRLGASFAHPFWPTVPRAYLPLLTNNGKIWKTPLDIWSTHGSSRAMEELVEGESEKIGSVG